MTVTFVCKVETTISTVKYVLILESTNPDELLDAMGSIRIIEKIPMLDKLLRHLFVYQTGYCENNWTITIK